MLRSHCIRDSDPVWYRRGCVDLHLSGLAWPPPRSPETRRADL